MSDLFEYQLIYLLELRAVKLVELVPAPDCWYVRINGCQWLRSSREGQHRFFRLEGTLAYLRDLGCGQVMVHLNLGSHAIDPTVSVRAKIGDDDPLIACFRCPDDDFEPFPQHGLESGLP